jgi:acyl dehydratase
MLPATRTLYFDDLALGMSETYSKQVKSSDVVGFAEISGDRNPIHLSANTLPLAHRSRAELRTGCIPPA